MPIMRNDWRSYALALSLATGIQVLWMVGVSSLLEAFRHSTRPAREQSEFELLQFTLAGDAVIARLVPDSAGKPNQLEQHLDPVTRELLPVVPKQRGWPSWITPPSRYSREGNLASYTFVNYGWLGQTWPRVWGTNDPTASSYFIAPDASGRSGYLEIFDSESRQRIGYLGKAGLQPERPAADQQFRLANEVQPSQTAGYGYLCSNLSGIEHTAIENDPFDPKHTFQRLVLDKDGEVLAPGQQVIVSEGRVLLIDGPNRTVRPLAPETDVIAVGIGYRPTSTAQTEHAMSILVWTKAKLLLLHPGAGRREEYILPAGMSGKSLVTFPLVNGQVVVAQSLPTDGGYYEARPDHFQLECWWLSPDQPTPDRKQTTTTKFTNAEAFTGQDVAVLSTSTAGSPALVGLTTAWLFPTFFDTSSQTSRFEVMTQAVSAAKWPVMTIFVLASTLAWQVARRQRRYKLPGSLGWMLFVFLLGIPGYCAYRTHRRWPVIHPLTNPKLRGIEVLTPVGG